jgi:hypothetical protein
MLETGFWTIVAMFAGVEFVVVGKELGVWRQELTRGDSGRRRLTGAAAAQTKGLAGFI